VRAATIASNGFLTFLDLGPNMKRWDCRTSAIADSTSVLIKEYCALRSKRETCMCIVSFSDDFFAFHETLEKVN
jgi:hypothetical protein